MRNWLAPVLVAVAAVATLTFTLAATAETDLVKARQGFSTTLTAKVSSDEELPEPPNSAFQVVEYPGPLGPMAGLVARPEHTGDAKSPAIVWLSGGFPVGGIGTSAWEPSDRENDQSAKAFRQTGMLVFYPTLRGSYGNPGVQESFLGEVDDALAAVSYIRGLPEVDEARVFVGGHSTGGTLALLVAAAATKDVAGVVSLGPVSSPAGYGADSLTFDPSVGRERRLRSPIEFLDAIGVPTMVIEGTVQSNADSLRAMRAATGNSKLRFIEVEGADHFNVIAPVVDLLAGEIVKGGFLVEAAEVQSAFDEMRLATHESEDLERLSAVRYSGVSLLESVGVEFYYASFERPVLEQLSKGAAAAGFGAEPITVETNSRGESYFLLTVERTLVLGELRGFLQAAAAARALAEPHEAIHYAGWSVPQ